MKWRGWGSFQPWTGANWNTNIRWSQDCFGSPISFKWFSTKEEQLVMNKRGTLCVSSTSIRKDCAFTWKGWGQGRHDMSSELTWHIFCTCEIHRKDPKKEWPLFISTEDPSRSIQEENMNKKKQRTEIEQKQRKTTKKTDRKINEKEQRQRKTT